MQTQKEINLAIQKLTKKIGTPIVREFNGFIILANSERDYRSKTDKINRGDNFGFYTVERANALTVIPFKNH